jgi:hypothetical protein
MDRPPSANGAEQTFIEQLPAHMAVFDSTFTANKRSKPNFYRNAPAASNSGLGATAVRLDRRRYSRTMTSRIGNM